MQTELKNTRTKAHPNCVLCRPSSERGLGVEFALSEDGSVRAEFECSRRFEGYADMLHGGLISFLLDGAMMNCMFAHGCIAVTAELKVRFLHPVSVGKPATVRAWMDRSSSHLNIVKAEVMQGKQVKATAVGKFMEQPRLPPGNGGTSGGPGPEFDSDE